MKSYATALGTVAQSLTKEQKAGLGFNVNADENELRQTIENKLNMLCAPDTIANQMIGRDPTMIDPATRIGCAEQADCRYPANEDGFGRHYGACGADKKCSGAPLPPNTVYCKNKGKVDLNYINDANASTACVLLAVQNAAAVAEQASSVKQAGVDIGLVIGLVLGGLALIAVIILMVKFIPSSAAGTTPSAMKGKL